MTWGLFDRAVGRLYLPRTWTSREDAEAFRQELLEPIYPVDHPWWGRLHVRRVTSRTKKPSEQDVE